MKQLIVVLFLLVGSITTFAQKPNDVVKFDKEVYDFGKIKQGTPVSYNFMFKNIAKAPVVIETATASCGCTTPKWPQAPVMPGKTNKVTAGFDAKNAGVFDKTITIKIQGVAAPKEIKIKGEVLTAEAYAKLPTGGKAKKG